MEELLIDDKKYVSTKQAAKLTGYAKDYVGQLCREGRVPARLVGRSWYVLASAIQDHRFSDKQESVLIAESAFTNPDPAPSGANFPRYEPYQAAPLPTLNRLEAVSKLSSEPIESKEIAPPDLRNSWNEWFDKNEQLNTVPVKDEGGVFQAIHNEIESTTTQNEESVEVPLHVVKAGLPHKDLLPSSLREMAAESPTIEPILKHASAANQSRSGQRTVLVFLGAVSALTLLLAALSTGYFDRYIISFKQAQYITGIYLYNK